MMVCGLAEMTDKKPKILKGTKYAIAYKSALYLIINIICDFSI